MPIPFISVSDVHAEASGSELLQYRAQWNRLLWHPLPGAVGRARGTHPHDRARQPRRWSASKKRLGRSHAVAHSVAVLSPHQLHEEKTSHVRPETLRCRYRVLRGRPRIHSHFLPYAVATPPAPDALRVKLKPLRSEGSSPGCELLPIHPRFQARP